MISNQKDVFLETARLGERNPVLVLYDEMVQFPRMRRRFEAYSLVDIAHVVMLIEQKILKPAGGGRLLRGLLDILAMGADRFPWLENSGSYLVHVEHVLGEKLGADTAGLLQTARSRNDQSAATERLFQRDLILRLVVEIGMLLEHTVALAATHADTIMPGYTHLQHAQPWTFGHYLMRQASIQERDLQRLRSAYDRTNLSALGGAANAGTSWPIDRRRISVLLGHDDLVVNSNDACGFARDFIEENTAVLAMVMSNLGRFANDLYVWSSWEFGLVEVSDGLAGTSSIMPQKKNPHSLERVKAVAGQAIGWLPSIMGNMRSISSTDLDFSYGDDLIGLYAESTYGCVCLMSETVRTLIVKEERMARTAGAFWSTTSHLADELVRRHDLTFRVAHQIVARFVKAAIEAGQQPGAVTGASLVDAAKQEAGIDIAMDDAEIRHVLDARHFIDTRKSEGSVAPAETRRHIEAMREKLRAHREWNSDTSKRARDAIDALLKTARKIAVAHA